MDVFKTMDVVSSALTAERTRLNAIASNLANANSVKRADGEGPYRRQDVVLQSVPMEGEFTEVLDKVQHPYTEVRVSEIKEDESEPLLVYKPEHPLANEEGYVAMPNVNPVTETANMISAERSYQNNVNIFQTTKQMALKALEIGK